MRGTGGLCSCNIKLLYLLTFPYLIVLLRDNRILLINLRLKLIVLSQQLPILILQALFVLYELLPLVVLLRQLKIMLWQSFLKGILKLFPFVLQLGLNISNLLEMRWWIPEILQLQVELVTMTVYLGELLLQVSNLLVFLWDYLIFFLVHQIPILVLFNNKLLELLILGLIVLDNTCLVLKTDS